MTKAKGTLAKAAPQKFWHTWQMFEADAIIRLTDTLQRYDEAHDLMAQHGEEYQGELGEGAVVVLSITNPKGDKVNANYDFLYGIAEYIHENDHLLWYLAHGTEDIITEAMQHLVPDLPKLPDGHIAYVPREVKRYS